MKTIHLLRVEAEPQVFEPLMRAAASAGLRLGWLQLEETEVPPALARAAEAGALRAVAAGGRRSVAVKERKGPAVLKDLLREHFGGCRAVLVRGAVDAPSVALRADGWCVEVGGAELLLSSEELVSRLRKPHPWGELPASAPTGAASV